MPNTASLSPSLRLMRRLRRSLLLWSFERLYHEFAWCYDLVAGAVSGGYWHRWIMACLPYLEGDFVLETGCGTGYLQQELARRGIAHIGIDASQPMLRGARRRIRSNLRLIVARAPSYPVPSACCSDVVATFPAPYLLQPTTLAEIRRVLRPGGQLVIVDGGMWRPKHDGSDDAPTYDDTHYRRPLVEHGFAVTTHAVAVGPMTVAVIVATMDGNDR